MKRFTHLVSMGAEIYMDDRQCEWLCDEQCYSPKMVRSERDFLRDGSIPIKQVSQNALIIFC
ncbi:MAG: hypothetical protein MJ198_10830 [Bacteroidales bacterium]|nr:hypothetical protein [Bacteroidales bacterium]